MSREIEFSTSITMGDEEIDVDVTATVSGKHVPMRWGPDGGSPEEFPEVDVVAVISVEGEDLTEYVDPGDMERLQEKAEERAGDMESDLADEVAEHRLDMREDR
ncbi:MAG: hypothetical protein RJA59_1635 [Pseudomonadota bacterium]